MFDSVFLFAKALEDLDRSTTLRPINVSCEENDPWSSGPSLYNYLNNVRKGVQFLIFNRFIDVADIDH